MIPILDSAALEGHIVVCGAEGVWPTAPETIRSETVTSEEIQKAKASQLLSAYRDAAAAHGQATNAGDHKTANREYKTIEAVYRELRARGRDAQETLLCLLESDDSGVRLWAGSHALDFAPTAGERTLTALANEQSLVGFSAEMTLKSWSDGMLRFP